MEFWKFMDTQKGYDVFVQPMVSPMYSDAEYVDMLMAINIPFIGSTICFLADGCQEYILKGCSLSLLHRVFVTASKRIVNRKAARRTARPV